MIKPIRSTSLHLAATFVIVGFWGASIGCEEPYSTTEKTTHVNISGKPFTLELAINQDSRVQGLSGRTSIADDGGMLFVFPDSEVGKHEFVMRDCPIPIDIIFLDRSRRVTATHAMKVEEARREGEDTMTYENRLKRYPSRFDSQFAIELQGGMLEKLSVKPGELINIDPSLASKAK
ncbi:MAG: DUF192 domain-containing protein [Phycisphaeraceae bacterium]|nr:DUF192 domain-containing protein [Phycisphaeraceae bacterium]